MPAATYVELTRTSITLMESSGLNDIHVRRRGQLEQPTKIKCVLKGRNATGSDDPADPDLDFIVPPTPQEEVFESGENQTCKA